MGHTQHNKITKCSPWNQILFFSRSWPPTTFSSLWQKKKRKRKSLSMQTLWPTHFASTLPLSSASRWRSWWSSSSHSSPYSSSGWGSRPLTESSCCEQLSITAAVKGKQLTNHIMVQLKNYSHGLVRAIG